MPSSCPSRSKATTRWSRDVLYAEPQPECEAMLSEDLANVVWDYVPTLDEACGPAHTDFVVAFTHSRSLALLLGALVLVVIFAQIALIAFRSRGI